MRTKKNELVSDEIKPFVCKIIKEARVNAGYSLEDLSKALNHSKNRQTLHKYETGILNIPYDVFYQICNLFGITDFSLDEIPDDLEEKEKFERKLIKEYISNIKKDKTITPRDKKLRDTYKNIFVEKILNKSDTFVKIIDDSMAPIYLKNDKVFFVKEDDYKHGDDVIIALKKGIVVVRRLYRYPKGVILQAMNPKYPTINVNVFSNDMILGKVISILREVK